MIKETRKTNTMYKEEKNLLILLRLESFKAFVKICKPCRSEVYKFDFSNQKKNAGWRPENMAYLNFPKAL